MKPVEQTIFTPPRGDCHAACIASILELPVERVPSMYAHHGEPGYDRDAAWFDLQRWLRGMGLSIAWFDRAEHPVEEGEWPGWRPRGYWIASHENPPGRPGHSTVWKNERLVWDPLPGASQLPDGRGELMLMEWFECLDPALLARNLPGRWRRAS